MPTTSTTWARCASAGSATSCWELIHSPSPPAPVTSAARRTTRGRATGICNNTRDAMSAIDDMLKSHKLSCGIRRNLIVCNCGRDEAAAELAKLRADNAELEHIWQVATELANQLQYFKMYCKDDWDKSDQSALDEYDACKKARGSE